MSLQTVYGSVLMDSLVVADTMRSTEKWNVCQFGITNGKSREEEREKLIGNFDGFTNFSYMAVVPFIADDNESA